MRAEIDVRLEASRGEMIKLIVISCPGRMEKFAQAVSMCENGVKPDFLILDGVMHDLPT